MPPLSPEQWQKIGPYLDHVHYMMNEAKIKAGLGFLEEAEKMSLALLDLEHRLIGPDSPEAAETTYYLATIKLKQGKKLKKRFLSSAMLSTTACCRQKL